MYIIMKIFLLIFFLMTISFREIFPFPGNHYSLTCDANFKEILLIPAIVDSKNTPYSKIDGTILSEFYRTNVAALTAVELAKHNQVIAAIQADIAKPYPQSIVKQNIRSRNISNDNGRTIHVTKWGDSLSDFIYFYELTEPACIYYPHYSIEEVTK